MDFKDNYPEYAAIESHIRKAHLERSLAVSQLLVQAALKIGRGLRSLGHSMGDGLAAERDRRAVEADSFLKRAVPRY